MLARRFRYRAFAQHPSRLRRHVATKSAFASSSLVTAKFVIALALGIHMFNEYCYSFDNTWGISMVPNLAADGDPVIISKYYRHGRGVMVGDLVTFVHPVDETARALKRVMGMPGDFVMRDSPHVGRQVMIQVPAGHCYVVGDNLDHSRDSRTFGPLPLALIKGKALCKITADGGWFPWPRRIGGGLEEPQELLEDFVD
ncbi:peptidase S24/S26A/S26B/S26C [Elsinoe ampelina]|uniref:Peptidase S24/S26A/S26B/S26C n=1 Tax=Elsinoe ampelina TaxID=302913 RepID=A0A6A6GJX6_9PEZI|nr:peptidase S24/S26A/S26B/S26C [Elsinoe ampelina]